MANGASPKNTRRINFQMQWLIIALKIPSIHTVIIKLVHSLW